MIQFQPGMMLLFDFTQMIQYVVLCVLFYVTTFLHTIGGSLISLLVLFRDDFLLTLFELVDEFDPWLST